jgi:hypothetical protein
MQSIDNKILIQKICFSHVSRLIQKRIVKISKDEQAEIDQIKEFLEEVINTKDSIEEGSCSDEEVQRFGQIMLYAGYHYGDRNIIEQQRIVNGAIEKFKEYARSLRDLGKNPDKFYWENPRKKLELLKICERLYQFLDTCDD